MSVIELRTLQNPHNSNDFCRFFHSSNFSYLLLLRSNRQKKIRKFPCSKYFLSFCCISRRCLQIYPKKFIRNISLNSSHDERLKLIVKNDLEMFEFFGFPLAISLACFWQRMDEQLVNELLLNKSYKLISSPQTFICSWKWSAINLHLKFSLVKLLNKKSSKVSSTPMLRIIFIIN